MPAAPRPRPDRATLLAAGAVALATGLGLAQLRLRDAVPVGVHLALLAPAAALLLALGMALAGRERRPAQASVLLVAGLVLLHPALLRLAQVLAGDEGDDVSAAALTWTSVAQLAAALWVAVRGGSAAALLLAAVAAAIALLAGLEWLADPDAFTAGRWLLLALAAVLAGAGVWRRRERRRAEVLLVAAGLAVLAIPVQALAAGLVALIGFFGGAPPTLLPAVWELVVAAAGGALVAAGVAWRMPGPAWAGAANLAAFVLVAGLVGDETLYWWPVLLLTAGVAALVAGLRPPAAPAASGAGEPAPGAAAPAPRAGDEDEVVIRVRDTRPPSR